MNIRDALRFLHGRVKPYRWQAHGAVALIFTRIAVGLVAPFMLLSILDEALPERDITQLVLLCGLTVVAGVFASVLSIVETVVITRISQRVVADLRVDMYDRVRDQPLDFYVQTSPSELQTRLLSDVNGVDRFLGQTARTGIVALTNACTAAIAMLVICWPLALGSLLLTVALTRLNSSFAQRRRELATRRQESLSDMVRLLSHDASHAGAILARTSGVLPEQRRVFEHTCDEIRSTTCKQRLVGSQRMALVSSAYACLPPAVYLLAGTVFTSLSVGAVVVLVMLQLRLTRPLEDLLSLSAGLHAAVATFERVMEYVALPASGSKLPLSAHGSGPVEVCLREVSLRYQDAGFVALKDLNLTFSAGSITYIVGQTGSGKSTLGLLLAGLLKPTAGEVLVEGEADARGALEARSVLVPQYVKLFEGTIADNLTFFRDGVSRENMRKVLRDVRLEGLARCLDEHIGTDGLRLSGGERQRLALARALLSDCGMIVLDEVTSALDETTSRVVHDNLRRYSGDRTLVVITHRMPPLATGDTVVTIEEGQLVHESAEVHEGGEGVSLACGTCSVGPTLSKDVSGAARPLSPGSVAGPSDRSIA